MRALRKDGRLSGNRLLPVGIYRNTVFLRPAKTDAVEIWSLHTLFPNSWKCLFSMPIDELFYVHTAFSYQSDQIFVLVIAIFKGEHDGRAVIFEIDRSTMEYKEFGLDLLNAEEFPSIPLEQASLAYGENGLHIYDRSIVMGTIPYWNIFFFDDKFCVRRNDVLDTTKAKCSRFTIAVDSGSRLFARLLDDGRLVVSSSDDGNWEEYLPSTDTNLNLSELGSRSINETFGRSGHRAGAVQSPLNIYCDGGVVIAKVTINHKHNFYRIFLDHDKREFRCMAVGAAAFRGSVDLMFYALVSERAFFLIGISSIAVADLQPASLAESALWRMQRVRATADSTGTCEGGYHITDFAKICGYAVAQSFSN